jgi:hypothetical protein
MCPVIIQANVSFGRWQMVHVIHLRDHTRFSPLLENLDFLRSSISDELLLDFFHSLLGAGLSLVLLPRLFHTTVGDLSKTTP